MFPVEGGDKNSHVCKNRARIPMSVKTGPESQNWEGWGQNSNVYKYRARIKVFERIEPEFNVYNGRMT